MRFSFSKSHPDGPREEPESLRAYTHRQAAELASISPQEAAQLLTGYEQATDVEEAQAQGFEIEARLHRVRDRLKDFLKP